MWQSLKKGITRLGEAAEKFTFLVSQRYRPLMHPGPLLPSFSLSPLSFQLVFMVSLPFAFRWFQTLLCRAVLLTKSHSLCGASLYCTWGQARQAIMRVLKVHQIALESFLILPLCLPFIPPGQTPDHPLEEEANTIILFLSVSLWIVPSFLFLFFPPSSMNWIATLNGKSSWMTSSSLCRKGVSEHLFEIDKVKQGRGVLLQFEFFPPELEKTNSAPEPADLVEQQR